MCKDETDPKCLLCAKEEVNIEHFILKCESLRIVRNAILQEITTTLNAMGIQFDELSTNEKLQHILDLTPIAKEKKLSPVSVVQIKRLTRRLLYQLHIARYKMETALTVEQQVCIALRFYASGSFLQVIGDTMGYDKATVSRAVNDVTNALIDVKDNFIQWPKDINSKNRMQCGFHRQMNFPNVLGCSDCTHVRIKGPSEDEEAFANRKRHHSVNVQAVCDYEGQVDTKSRDNCCRQTHSSYELKIVKSEPVFKVRMKPEKVCRVFGACAILHNIALTRNEPLDDVCDVDVHQDQPVQVPPFEGEQDSRHIREHIARVFFNRNT
ncbi:HARBI1 [Mytilus coruscus]|uniref:Putative nuclease HARBI1 n=1 Tax=Mytilus coruscus TaxID=42192 RepID=A0A6J8F190_MYTCO|nr:HARBI1 [Mytilus coruscus]